MQDYITLNYNWLKLQDYQFKMLILIKMLATDKEQITYTGTLQDIRQWLHLGDNTKNNKSIIKAIEELKNNNIIDYIKTGRTYTITIIDKVADNEKVIDNIKKEWLDNIRTYNINNNKRVIETMVKVLLYAYDNKNAEYNTREEISNILNITPNQLKNGIDNLLNCHFIDYSLFAKDYEKKRTSKGNIIIGLILQFTPNGIYNNN